MSNFIIYSGTDYKRISQEVRKLIDGSQMPYNQSNSVSSIVSRLYQKSLLSGSQAFIIRYDDDFIKADEADWQRVLDNIHDNVVILLYTTIDKRSRFYKFFKKYIKIYDLPEQEKIIFSFVESVCKRDIKKSFEYADNIKVTDVFGAFSLLYKNFRAILQIQTTPKNIDLESNTGLTSRDTYFVKRLVGYYNKNELIFILRYIDYILSGIQSGIVDIDVSLCYFLVNIL